MSHMGLAFAREYNVSFVTLSNHEKSYYVPALSDLTLVHIIYTKLTEK